MADLTFNTFSAAKETLKEVELNDLKVKEWFLREDMEVSEKIIGLVIDSLSKLSLVKAALNNNDPNELSGYKLEGVIMSVNDAVSLLEVAVNFHSRTH